MPPDETTEVQATEAEVTEAKALGWADRDSWRGKPEDWVDARQFLERGNQLLPMLRENNKRLVAEVGGLKAEMLRQRETQRAAEAALAALQASHEEDLKAAREAEREALKEEIRRASEEGDHAAIAEATVKLTELGAAEKAAAKAKVNGEQPPANPMQDAAIKAWFDAHPEMLDNRRAALGNAIIAEMRQKGDMRMGTAILDDVAKEVEKVFGAHTVPARDGKVDGGNTGGGRDGGGGPTKKGYAELPPDAKAACSRMAGRLVGQGRAHKDLASWQASYAKQYWEPDARGMQ